MLVSRFVGAQEVPLDKAVRELISAGFQDQRVPFEELQSQFGAGVAELGQPHPLLDYAYSIVLRKNFHASEGQKYFDQAVGSSQPVVLLAREQVIHRKLKKRGFAAAIPMLVQLAKTVGEIPPANQQSIEAKRSAAWIGSAMAFLKNSIDDEELAVEIREAEPQIVQNLGRHYVSSYQSGRLKTALKTQAMLSKVDEVREQVQKEKNELAVEARNDAQEVTTQKQAFTEKVEDFRDVANDDLSDLDSKLAVLEKQFEASLEAERTMTVTATGLRLDLQRLYRELELINSGSPVASNGISRGPIQSFRDANLIEQQITFIEQQLVLMNRDYSQLLVSRSDLMAVAKQMIAKRRAMAANFQSAAQAANAQMLRLERMQQRIEKAEAEAAESPDLAPQVVAKLRQLKDFTNYDRRGLVDERDLLLQSLNRE